MSTLPPLDSLVQSLVDALSPVLSPLLSSLPLVDLFHHADKTLRDAVLDATREVTQRALSQPKRPEPGASKKTFQVHSALGLLTFVRWGTRDEQGCWQDPLPHAVSGRGCTAAVRQQIAWLHALMTTQETCSTLRLFHAAQPSLATVHRVAVEEGCALAKEFSPELFGPLLEARVQPIAAQVDLIVVGADAGHVPMRGEGSSAEREWHEGRVVTATLLGAPDPSKPRTVTLFDGKKRKKKVGYERPVLATVVLGQMPTLDGPRADRVEAGVKKLHTTLQALCPQATWQGLCDGGDWPEEVVDATVGSSRRTTDFYHASAHLLDAAKARFKDPSKAHAWWAEKRTQLLTEPGEAKRVAEELRRSAAHLTRSEAKKEVGKEAGYFEKRAATMEYAKRLAGNEVIGSGRTEAAVKQLITVRLKRVGATWGAEGGDAVMHTRSLVVSQLFEGAWEDRVQKQFAPYLAAA
jgi:hypothetical protein